MTIQPANYPYQELEFAKDGSQVDPGQAAKVGELAGQVTDLVVMSHGWNNDMDEARGLYRDLAASFDAVRSQGSADLGARTLGIVGVLWPSKKFADAELIPGGAAAIGASDPTLSTDLRAMADAFEAPHAAATLHKAAELVNRLEESEAAQREYADLMRSLVDSRASEAADAADQLFSMDGVQLLDRLQQAMLTVSMQQGLPDQGGAASVPGHPGVGLPGADLDAHGGAAGLSFDLGAIWSKGRALLNCLTYYEMKARAGAIGAGSLGPVLHAQTAAAGLPTRKTRLHLLGHSFGARLVTAAANALPDQGEVSSLSLLQGAFSHNSFAKEWEPGKPGGFRPMIDARRISGSMIITHTRNDMAVGIAYAIASSVAGQTASAIGDASSPYGGLGSNGAQHTSEASDGQPLQDLGASYQFDAAKIYNLLADNYVSGHSDVTNVQVANAVLHNVIAASSD